MRAGAAKGEILPSRLIFGCLIVQDIQCLVEILERKQFQDWYSYLTSSRVARLWCPNLSTSASDASILAGPLSKRTSSAFRTRLGGSPTGRSRASRDEGRCNLRSTLHRNYEA